MDKEQRLRIEAIVFSSDILAFGLVRLLDLADQVARLSARGVEAQRLQMFMHGWSCVDQLYALRQLLQPFWKGGRPWFDRFFLISEPAAKFRNKMDHLEGNLGNFSRSKSATPLLGAIAYFHTRHDEAAATPHGATSASGRIVSLAAGSLLNDDTSLPVPNPAGKVITPPVDLLRMSAFDEILELQECVSELRISLLRLEGELSSEITQSIELLAGEKGLSSAVLRRPVTTDLTVIAEIKFDPTATNPG